MDTTSIRCRSVRLVLERAPNVYQLPYVQLVNPTSSCRMDSVLVSVPPPATLMYPSTPA